MRRGELNVSKMLREMTAKCFYGWQAYDALEPFTERREDTRNAWIVKALWDIARDTKKHPAPFEIKDFLLNFEEQPQEDPDKARLLEQERLVKKMQLFTAMLGGQADESTAHFGTRSF